MMKGEKFKLGLDLHGVIDKTPKFFSLISKLLIENGHEVHIMTGEHSGENLEKQLNDCNIDYTHLFSIADYHKENGAAINYDSDGNPWMDSKLWDKSKAEYAEKNELNLVIDDTARYGAYFKSLPFMAVDIHLPNNEEKKWVQHRREGMKDAEKTKKWIRKKRDLKSENYPNVVGLIIDKDGSLSFQEMVDIAYEKGIDLYRVVCVTKKNDMLNTYHLFLAEPFFEEDEWRKCVWHLLLTKDSRFWGV